MSNFEFDALVIGCGIAGLTTATKLAESGIKVGIVTRERDPKKSNTLWAQGGIICPKEDDHSLIDDIFKASANTSFKDAAEILRTRSARILNEILIEKAQTEFSKDEDGKLLFTKEAAHSTNRILYKGDFTGKEIQISLLNYLKDEKRFPNVKLLTGFTAIDLLTPIHHGVEHAQRYEEHQVVGAYLFDRDNKKVVKAIAKKTILATGGIGALYQHHSNSRGARGDGHAMAKRAGAMISNMEFIQFHPTTFFDSFTHGRFLISEAVRGEGGILKNIHGEEFMENYHPDKELAPRDVVARAIVEEIIKTGHDCVYLDISHKDGEWIKERFPTIYAHCLENHVDMTTHSIPVVPSAHYTCGGVKTDLLGKTNLNNLYAVGEVACTGLHGANRLASTSLLEGLTWGYIAAEDISKSLKESSLYSTERIKDWKDGTQDAEPALILQDWTTLKQTMWNYLGLVRSTDRLDRANAMFSELSDEIGKFYRHSKLTDGLIGLRNAVEVSFMVLQASRKNSESVGCFYKKI